MNVSLIAFAMTVHSLVLFENGTYTEISKALDISVHNSIISPETNDFVEDNYITFFYPKHLDHQIVYEYAREHELHLIDGSDISEMATDDGGFSLRNTAMNFDNWFNPEHLEGYHMFRIHYWTDEPIHWVLNPKTDLFVFNRDIVESLALCN